MRIYLSVKPTKQNSVLRKVRKFTKIVKRAEIFSNNKIVVLLRPFSTTDTKQINELKKKFTVDGIIGKPIIGGVYPEKEDISENIFNRNIHFFFDIDSTLTDGPPGILDRKVRPLFNKMQNDNGYRIYLASGRTLPQVIDDIADLNVEPYAIAESGGIIIGIGTKGIVLHGDRTEPDKLLTYLKQHFRKNLEDVLSRYRLTERIFKNTLDESKFREYATRAKAKVDIHASKTSYHVSKEKINKGSALKKLTHDVRFGDRDYVIVVGDSGLDVPMFEEADFSFAVGNATDDAKIAASISLEQKNFDGVIEMYNCWFKK